MPLKRTETAIGGRDGIAYIYPLPNARKRRHGPENGIVARFPFRRNRAIRRRAIKNPRILFRGLI